MPVTAALHSDQVILADDERKIAYHQQCIVRIVATSHKAHHTFFRVVGIHPLKPVVAEILLIERRFTAVKTVEILNPATHSGVLRILQRFPFQALVVLPLMFLSEFAAHDIQAKITALFK